MDGVKVAALSLRDMCLAGKIIYVTDIGHHQ